MIAEKGNEQHCTLHLKGGKYGNCVSRMSRMNQIYQKPLNYNERVGVVLGSFSPLHKGHLSLIYKAKKECSGGVVVVCCGSNGDKGYPNLPLEKRYRLVREYFKDDDLVAVYSLSDDEMGIAGCTDQWGIWLDHFMNDVVARNAGTLDGIKKENIVFYNGEAEYDRYISSFGFGTSLVDRTVLPITATMIRSNPLKYWDMMAWTFHRVFSHNILITGTASEGKTTLVEDIGGYFNIPYSYEWARGYIADRMVGDWEFDCQDFLTFLDGQFNYNRKCVESRANKGIFISDTDSIVTKMYAKYYAQDEKMALTEEEYNTVIAPAADVYARKSHWDKVFLLLPKDKFVDDHMRYLAHSSLESREELADILKKELRDAGLMEVTEVLDGGYYENFERVKSYISNLEKGKEQ